jgi:voltage-gated potassium channel
MDKIDAFMSYHKIPLRLRSQVRKYHEHLWETRLGYDESAFLNELPSNLRINISLFLKQNIIQKTPIFQGANEELIKEIATQLKAVVYAPGDYVFKYGDDANEMYFISSGLVEVLSQDELTVYAVLEEGNFFGEVALLGRSQRNATIRAVDYCNLYILEKEAFDRVTEKYPEFAEQVRAIARQRKGQSRITQW